ncbi:protein kinase [Cellulomonas hominis]|uniref:non-specific serine/threonine protein kinase n=1 Tax=Cellulomonas hominis TaxID=156981 RepID=A0A511FCM7_9CELL|nr:Stk1 family PASTA domain-containing Ser/Thr kinase [Cellulomonas hominis]NKY07272.1 Stk1 family PASTA domain-containing Ser/Thr kinase [Cellulomonas hominis]NKY11568.1 Stk1 family PASTA domain-containing Ser/Thr kinase [Cellulomonas hominis]GEL47000.1 protein kinase [Cellulomonas hominis]
MVDDGSRILAGRYEVGELIGRGGMAEVHIGHDTRLGRTVAIKILRSDLARDPSFQARFRREAQAAAALNHPAIVAVYDTGEDVYTEPTGAVAHVPFIVMEYVEGHTVRDILRDGQAVPIEEAIEITAGVLSALEYSHHAGIVHRDIKPANVMLTPTGAVKVMDFGIARAVADSAATMTQTQAVIGTAQYLSPEQARGETVDARSDLYSAGCLLFELLTGRPPFVGDSPVAVAYQHVREIAPAPSSVASDVPEVLDRITAKALAKERDARYSSAAEFRADLEAAARGGHVSAPAVAAAALGAGAATQVLGPDAAATQIMPGDAPAWAPTNPGTAVLTATPGEDEEPEQKSRRWLWITLAVVAVLAVAGIVALLMQDRTPPVVNATVPDVVGMAEADALAALQDAGFEGERQEETSADVAPGSVTRSDPAAGEEAPKDSTVQFWVSTGPDSVAVPDVTGLTQDAARKQLEGAGLTVGNVTEEDSPDQPADRALRTEPAAGQSVADGSAVNLFIASGNVDLPDLRGQAQADAVATLNGLKLGSNIREEETTDAAPGTVIDQDRSGIVQQQTVVVLTVAKAPPEPTTVQIPGNITSMNWSQASAALTQLGLVPVQEYANVGDSDKPKDAVLSTNPAPNSTVETGSQVTVTLSAGPDTSGND